jgi:hypothetical protein
MLMKFVYRRRGKKGNEELVGTEGIINCTRGSQGVEGSMGVSEGEVFKGGGHA